MGYNLVMSEHENETAGMADEEVVKDTTSITLPISRELMEKLKKGAAENMRSVAGEVRYLITRHHGGR